LCLVESGLCLWQIWS